MREGARIDHALAVFDELLDGAGVEVESLADSPLAETPPSPVERRKATDLWSLMRLSGAAVVQRLIFELRWRPMRLAKRLRRVREHYTDLKRFAHVAKKEAAARRHEELYQRARCERLRPPGSAEDVNGSMGR